MEAGWLKDAMLYLINDLSPVQKLEIDGRNYTDRCLNLIKAPIINPVCVTTLTGLLDLVAHAVEGFPENGVFLHVVDHTEVQLVKLESDSTAQRTIYAKADLPQTEGFRFGQYMSHEAFCIGVQAQFVQQNEPTLDDKAYVLRIASTISNEAVNTSQDDGISQNVAVKRGVSLKTEETLRSRVKLAPYRTFREVEQPISEFIFRASKNQATDGIPNLALFEADGGAWRIEAMQNIGMYLAERAPKISVVA